MANTKKKRTTKFKADEYRLPDIPSELWTPLGLIPITKVEGLAGDNGDKACGMWLNGLREVKIAQHMHPIADWQTVGHELAHVILHDAGAQLDEKQEEAVCDAFGSYIAAFVLNGGTFPFGGV